MSEDKANLPTLAVPESITTQLPDVSFALIGDEVVIDLGKPVRFLKLKLPIARQLITHLRRFSNMLERKQRLSNGRGIRTRRR